MKQLVSTKRGKGGPSSDSQTPNRKKGKMEVKDPNAPKKPVNAYVMFFQHNRHTVQEKYFKVRYWNDHNMAAIYFFLGFLCCIWKLVR